MRSTTRTFVTLVFGAFLVAACSGATTSSTPAASTLPAVTPGPAVATPSPAPTPTTPAMTSGLGAQHFSAVAVTGLTLEHPYKVTKVGDVMQYRGGVSAWDITTTDPRMHGHVRLPFSLDVYAPLAGPEWGTVTITDTAGTWTGQCTAVAWGPEEIASGCGVVGGGAYKGYSAYYTFVWNGSGSPSMEGVIFPGPLPKA